jgi:uncharacterized membrane protein HdeD (DUF308 family)
MLNNPNFDSVLLGAICMASVVAGLFFLRFWRNTKDRFFLYFAISFFLEGVNRFLIGLTAHPNEGQPLFYLIRAIAYVLIIVAIVHKNRVARAEEKPAEAVLPGRR